MATAVPANLRGLPPSGEPLPSGGPIYWNEDAILGGGVRRTGWLDVAAWGDIHLQMNVGAGGGTLVVEWSMNSGGAIHFTTVPPLAPVVAGVPYDSNAIVPLAQYMRITYTQGGAPSPAFLMTVLVAANAAGGGIGPIVVNVDVQGNVESLPAPSPSSIRGVLGDLALLEEPDHALRTRARVLTDERTFSDDFPGAALARVLATGATSATFTTGSVAVTGVGTAFRTSVRVGDYVYLDADTYVAARPVLSIESDTALTLAFAYGGAGGAGNSTVQNYTQFIGGVGAATTVANSIVTLAPALDAAGQVSATRNLYLLPVKGFVPLRASWYGRISARRPGQYAYLRLYGTGATIAGIRFDGNDADTIVQFITRSSTAATGTQTTYVVLPDGAVGADYNYYEVALYADHCELYVNHVRVAQHVTHLPDPYASFASEMSINNGGGIPAGATTLDVDWTTFQSLNVLDVQAVQDNPDKLRVAAQLNALAQSLPEPNPAAILSTSQVPLHLDPDRALLTRARVLTDEGSFSDDFLTAALPRALIGTSLFTAGSVVVVGTGTFYTTEVRVGDFVELTADHSDLTPVWAQVYSIIDNTHLTLSTAYVGAGGPTGASQVQNYSSSFDAVGTGSGIAVAASVCSLVAGTAITDYARIHRRVGVAGRKGFPTLRATWLGSLSQRVANQTARVGFIGIDAVTGVLLDGINACFFFDGVVPSWVKCRTRSAAIAADTWDETVNLPVGASSVAMNLYQIIMYQDRVQFLVNHIQVALHAYHLPDPYQEMAAFVQIENAAGFAGVAGTLAIDWLNYGNRDVVDVEAYQCDPDKLQMSMQEIGLVGTAESVVPAAAVNTALIGTDATRRGFLIYNDSNKKMRIAYTVAATFTTPLVLEPGATYVDEHPPFWGSVYGIWEPGVAGQALIRITR